MHDREVRYKQTPFSIGFECLVQVNRFNDFSTAQVGFSIYSSNAVFLVLSKLLMIVWLLSAEILLAIDDLSGYIIYNLSKHKYMVIIS